MKPSPLTAALFLALFLAPSATLAAEEAPPWLTALRNVQGPPAGKLGAVTLLEEDAVTVDEDGALLIVNRKAIRVVTKQGRDEAEAAVTWDAESDKLKSFKAWVVPPEGPSRRVGKDLELEATGSFKALQTERRVRAISAGADLVEGSLFGIEWEMKMRPLFAQLDTVAQGRLPVAAYRLVVSAPPGWRVDAEPIAKAPPVRTQRGTATVLEWRDLPEIPDEPASPPLTQLAPRILLSFRPPEGTATDMARTFGAWSDVSRWLDALFQTSQAPSEDLLARAHTAVEGATSTKERVERLASFVQGLTYVSVEIGLRRGGGYRPRPAAAVLESRWGDCKDKTALLVSLLRAVGIEAFPVGVYLGDPDAVKPSWITPQQFNHMITAVPAPEGVDPSAVATDTKHGKLWLVDPTDSGARAGELPEGDQGGWGLVVSSKADALMRLPSAPASANAVRSRSTLTVQDGGAVTLSIVKSTTGEPAASARALRLALDRGTLGKLADASLTDFGPGAKVLKVTNLPAGPDGPDPYEVQISAPRFTRSLGADTLLCRSSLMSPSALEAFPEKERRLPIVVPARTYEETLVLKLPPTLAVDELPGPGRLETEAGTLTMDVKTAGDGLTVTRTLVLKPGTHPPERVGALRDFYGKVRGAFDAPIVLKRKP